MNFSSRVLQVTQDAMAPFVIEAVAGKFARRQHEAWRSSKEYTTALKQAFALNSRQNGSIPLTDRRSRGYKHLNAAYEKFAAQYKKDYPELPEERRFNLSKVSGITAV